LEWSPSAFGSLSETTGILFQDQRLNHGLSDAFFLQGKLLDGLKMQLEIVIGATLAVIEQ